MRNITWFEDLKEATAGMLPAAGYRRLYSEAQARPDDDCLEVGVGRGAGSISLATGIADAQGAGRVCVVDQFYQMSAPRPHKYTLNTEPDAQRKNAALHSDNLERYGVRDRVEVFIGRTDEAAARLDPARRFGLLFIDVDGLIDRDLALFYNSVKPGGVVIIDDVMTNEKLLGTGSHGGPNIEKARQEGVEPFIARLNDFNRKRLLGKFFLTRILLDTFCERGLLSLTEMQGAIAVCKKTGPEKADASAFLDNDSETVVIERFRELVGAE